MKILLLILVLFSCGKKKEPFHTAEFSKSYLSEGIFTGKRVYLTHGLHGFASDFYSYEHLVKLKDGLIAKGYQVIIYDYPYTQRSTFSNNGQTYRKRFSDFLEWMTNDCDTKYGPAVENMIGGISFGGLHTFMGLALSQKFDKYFVVLPVTDPVTLKEFKGLDDDFFNALKEVEAISKKPGIILYGTNDYRVDFRLTVKLIEELTNTGADVIVEEVQGLDHSTTDAVVQKILDHI